MLVRPAEVLLVGCKPLLAQFNIALDPPTTQALSTQSVFGLDEHPGSGAVAVGGCHASLELLSRYGKKLGGTAFVSQED